MGILEERLRLAAVGLLDHMWQRLNNFLRSLETYGMLSPDYVTRRQVNEWLRDRPALTSKEWYDSFFKAAGLSRSVVAFAYQHLEQYSGLQVARMLPIDHLEDDLHWTQVCAFDWELALSDDFRRHFGVNLDERIYTATLTTVEDIVLFLNCQLLLFKPVDPGFGMDDVNFE